MATMVLHLNDGCCHCGKHKGSGSVPIESAGEVKIINVTIICRALSCLARSTGRWWAYDLVESVRSVKEREDSDLRIYALLATPWNALCHSILYCFVVGQERPI
jgi:hypothetical protein